MTTTRWRSSLGNIETALRRKLGIAGPIGLELGEPSVLTPVVIADDLTRPGASSALRGRRFRVSTNFSAATQGAWFVLADAPYVGSTQGRPDTYAGGVVIDRITMSANCAAAIAFHPCVVYWPTPLMFAPGLPIAVTTFDGWMVDPMRIDAEPAPILTGVGNPQNPASAGRVIWEAQVHVGPGLATVFDIPADFFLNWNSAIAIGNRVSNGGNPVTMYANISGRVF